MFKKSNPGYASLGTQTVQSAVGSQPCMVDTAPCAGNPSDPSVQIAAVCKWPQLMKYSDCGQRTAPTFTAMLRSTSVHNFEPLFVRVIQNLAPARVVGLVDMFLVRHGHASSTAPKSHVITPSAETYEERQKSCSAAVNSTGVSSLYNQVNCEPSIYHSPCVAVTIGNVGQK
jgi:hypothetical protein